MGSGQRSQETVNRKQKITEKRSTKIRKSHIADTLTCCEHLKIQTFTPEVLENQERMTFM